MKKEDAEKYVDMYQKMCLIRSFENQARNLFMKDKIRGATHSYIGEEAIAVGFCGALNKEDYISSTHRGHGHCLAKGGDPNKMMAELLGRSTGYCKGKGGSMHIADLDIGILGANGIVGGGIGLAAGAALACKYRGSKCVSVCFFGDGAINQGVFFEVANMSALWKLPVIFVCERNKFAEFSYADEFFADNDLTKRTEPFGFKGIEVDGNDLVAVYTLAQELVEKARNGGGPFLVIANTYRIFGHTVGDPLSYRKPGEAEVWKDEEHDPILRLKHFLLQEGIVSLAELEGMERTTEKICVDAVDFALNSPIPDSSSLLEDMYAEEEGI